MIQYIFLVSLLVASSVQALPFRSRLINGNPVEPGTFNEVVLIHSSGSNCTATVVGPRTIITASHCANTGATATFKVGEKQYNAKITRSPLYPGQDHDIAVGVTNEDITGVEPASVGGKPENGLGITLLGYGCIKPGGGGGNDGVLRMADTVIVNLSNFDIVSRKPDGAALCFGDSGGPAFVFEGKRHLLIGVNSKGNIQDTNYDSRTDIDQSRSFFNTIIENQKVEICGINKKCGEPAPIVEAPTCKVSLSSNSVNVGGTITATMTVTGEVTEAILDGRSLPGTGGEVKVTPTEPGVKTVVGKVTGPGGSGQCSADFTALNNSPDVPDFTAVPTYCGENTIAETAVKDVCTGYLKFSNESKTLQIKELVIVTFRDGTQELLPVILKQEKETLIDGNVTWNLTLYGNGYTAKGTNLILDTRSAHLIVGTDGANKDVPVALVGRSAKAGQAFYVEQFKKMGNR